jgi:hypothetical protein
MFTTVAQGAGTNPVRIVIFPNDRGKARPTGDNIESHHG